jgi:poly-beta-1,6-N-acetyl-D-glucosamine synthase
MTAPAYVIITPVRNEAGRVGKTIESVASQTLRPRQWVIIDDGSSDGTPDILKAAQNQHSWIKTVSRADRGSRKPGGGVIEAFYDGYKEIDSGDWAFLVKLDGDLQFGPSYFEDCLQRFHQDSELGIGGGTICCEQGGQWVQESRGDPPFHVRGATKIYRHECWAAIGGLIKAPGWDTLDEVKANMLGWKTYSFAELKLLQLKSTGAADGAWKNWVKNGRANYITGYHPLFMLLKCVKRLVEKPYAVAGVGLLVGFLSGYVSGQSRVEDPELIRYLRRQQINRLLFRNSLWAAPVPAAPLRAEAGASGHSGVPR